jgi:hypothetical protein
MEPMLKPLPRPHPVAMYTSIPRGGAQDQTIFITPPDHFNIQARLKVSVLEPLAILKFYLSNCLGKARGLQCNELGTW